MPADHLTPELVTVPVDEDITSHNFGLSLNPFRTPLGGKVGAAYLNNSKLSSFMFSGSPNLGNYALVAVRLAVAAFWINSDLPRWAAIAAGTPQANGLVKNLFGASMVVPLTYFFTALETLGAIALILGLLTRLASVWAVVEFAITGTFGIMIGNVGLAKDFGLFAGALVLLLNGSPALSIDGLIAKRKGSQ